MTIYVDIKTKSGVYRVKKPLGRIGAIHFGIITKHLSSGSKEEEISPAQRESIGDGFIEWTEKVLPKIIISYTPNDQPVIDKYNPEDITGEDQFAIFSAMMSLIEVSEDYFQIIKS